MENEGQGNCLFQGFAQSIEKSGGGKRNHLRVRSAVVAHLLKHKEKYYAFWDKRNPHDQLMTDSSIEGVAEYLKMVSHMGQWARRACNNIAQTRTSLSL